MRQTAHSPKLAAALVIVFLAVSSLSGGCGEGGSGGVDYTVEQGGITIGSQTVRAASGENTFKYSGVERRPFKVYPTTTSRKLTLSADRDELIEYYANRRVPGASYRTYIEQSGDAYSFLADRLQTFDYVPALTDSRRLLPIEPDSVCLLQALCDRFVSSGFDEAQALVVVPSRGGLLRDILLERSGEDGLGVSGEGLPELEISLDDSGIISSVEGGGLSITRVKRAGEQDSKPFAPTGKARAVKEVRVPTAEGEDLELAGSLYVPTGRGPYRTVVLAGDLGPQDRTGRGFLSQFAEELVDKGMAVLVCDRRGIPESKGDYATYTRETAISDLNAQLDYLVFRGDVDAENISLIGYGEGGQLAIEVAAVNPYVSSLVLIATPSVRLFPELSAVQAEVARQVGIITELEADAALVNIANQETVVQGQDSDYADIEGRKLFLGWMRSEEESNPLAPLASIKVPVLVVQGGRDLEVPQYMAEEIMAGLGSRDEGVQELALFKDLGHNFGPLLLEGAAVPYRAHPEVDPEVLNRVSDWIKAK